MPSRWASINEPGLPLAALPTPASPAVVLPTPSTFASAVPECKAEKPAKDDRNKSSAANSKCMEKHVADLRREIALNAGIPELPAGITSENSVIRNILANGVPDFHSNGARKWTDDEDDFVLATMNWPHSRLAAYLGRTCQASRLARTRLIHNPRRRRVGSRTRTASNSTSPATGSSGSNIASGADNSPDSNTDSGVDLSFDSTTTGAAICFSERSVASSASGSINTTSLLPSPKDWAFGNPFDKNFFGKYPLSSEVQRLLSRAEEVYYSLPEGKVVPWRSTSGYEQGLTAQQMQDRSKGSNLHMLANVAETVDPRASAVSRPAPPTRSGQAKYHDSSTRQV